MSILNRLELGLGLGLLSIRPPDRLEIRPAAIGKESDGTCVVFASVASASFQAKMDISFLV